MSNINNENFLASIVASEDEKIQKELSKQNFNPTSVLCDVSSFEDIVYATGIARLCCSICNMSLYKRPIFLGKEVDKILETYFGIITKTIIRSRYGMDDSNMLSLYEISEKIGFSLSEVICKYSKVITCFRLPKIMEKIAPSIHSAKNESDFYEEYNKARLAEINALELTPIEHADFSTRTYTALRYLGYETLEQLAELYDTDLPEDISPSVKEEIIKYIMFR